MLKEQTLFGEVDKEKTAIERIKGFADMARTNNENGYYVAISGGKDSSVIQQLCIMSGVKCEFVHHHTTADDPETVKFVRQEKTRVEKLGYKFTISYPKNSKGERISMWSEITRKGFPTRIHRWCCAVFKESGGKNRFVVTGVRWSESAKRKNNRGTYETVTKNMEDKLVLNNDNDMKRQMTERCITKGNFILNPIIDWEDVDVWEFIEKHGLPYNCLYDKGYKRIGCVGCPMNSKSAKELEANPQFKKMYLNAGAKYLEYRVSKGRENYGICESAESYYNWWIGRYRNPNKDKSQLTFDEVGNEINHNSGYGSG